MACWLMVVNNGVMTGWRAVAFGSGERSVAYSHAGLLACSRAVAAVAAVTDVLACRL